MLTRVHKTVRKGKPEILGHLTPSTFVGTIALIIFEYYSFKEEDLLLYI